MILREGELALTSTPLKPAAISRQNELGGLKTNDLTVSSEELVTESRQFAQAPVGKL